MIVLGAKIKTELLTKRGIDQITRTANRLEMIDHKVNRLPLHFQNVPDARVGGAWGFKPRSRNYQIRKAKRFGHTRLLVYSGDLERAVLSSAKVTATSKRARLQARGSRGSNLRTQYREEIEAVSQREQDATAESWESTFTTLATQPRFQQKRATR